VARSPSLWLFVVPATLPVLNFAPWTGWITFDESDLLLLGTVAGGLAWLSRQALTHSPIPPHSRDRVAAVGFFSALGLGFLSLPELARGVVDAGGWSPGWFDGYSHALNSVRVAKSLWY